MINNWASESRIVNQTKTNREMKDFFIQPYL